ncbi:GNAT family N-acetyltransferase [Proteiniborus sp. MB09-C3]|uniref:GNAT family N-acetyltransferase n=1 Tax=Proteiniborus sp. MB09-C3 TaxID=3050072 RepID=UPI0025557C6D|nr:GNAT family N-acetyltransferase [Proteiniborus sp. MB09-C3]WIV13099.1 GNAT family N-acetyltransferase [Proteiniborus sp. MB09-C3]
MGDIIIQKVVTKKHEKNFIRFLWEIYADDECWVPQLISDYKKTIRGKNNSLVQSGPFEHIIAYRNHEICGRLCVGINEELNNAKNYKEGYISLFECIDDYKVAKEMFNYASNWLSERGMERIIGPISLPNGDDNRGLIIDNFTDPTLVMNTYNKSYYREFFEKYGFYKYWDCYAYRYDIEDEIEDRYRKYVPYAMEKYKFRVDKIDLKNIEKEMKDVKQIIDEAMPKEWDDFIPPTDEEIEIIGKSLVPVADPDLIYIARTEEGKPIGFNIALPDYNQVLKKMNGRLFPIGFIKFLYYKKKIDRARLFVLFVIPEYRRKGVPSAIYLNLFDSAKKKGYKYGEGSTVWEYNKIMQRDIEKFGGKIYKTYRIYKKDL